MAVKIRLKRLGKIRNPQYRIVVADSRTKRDGRAIEEIGKYQPKEDPSLIEVNSERAQYWLKVGAQPTEPVLSLLKLTGDWQRFQGDADAVSTVKQAAPRADKKAAYDKAAKEAAGTSGGGATKQAATKKAAAQDTAKQDTAKQDTAKQDTAKQDTARQDTAEQQTAEESKPASSDSEA